MSTVRLRDFDDNISRARDLVGLGQAIGALTNGRVDAADIYRAALVQAVAALDRYVHGVVLDRAVDTLFGRRPIGASAKIGFPLGTMAGLLTEPDPILRELGARSLVAERLARETFQRPDDVADALAMVGVRGIWSAAFPDAGAAKISLGVIVDRRNKIVHQCDYDPASPGSVTPLTSSDALDAIATVVSTVKEIDAHC